MLGLRVVEYLRAGEQDQQRVSDVQAIWCSTHTSILVRGVIASSRSAMSSVHCDASTTLPRSGQCIATGWGWPPTKRINISYLATEVSLVSIRPYQRQDMYRLNIGSTIMTPSPGSTNADSAARMPAVAPACTATWLSGSTLCPRTLPYSSATARLKFSRPLRNVSDRYEGDGAVAHAQR